MTKLEFISKISTEKPNIFPYRVKLDSLSRFPRVFGCYREGNLWKAYITDGKGHAEFLIETEDESLAFSSLYQNIVAEANRKLRSKKLNSKNIFRRHS